MQICLQKKCTSRIISGKMDIEKRGCHPLLIDKIVFYLAKNARTLAYMQNLLYLCTRKLKIIVPARNKEWKKKK